MCKPVTHRPLIHKPLLGTSYPWPWYLPLMALAPPTRGQQSDGALPLPHPPRLPLLPSFKNLLAHHNDRKIISLGRMVGSSNKKTVIHKSNTYSLPHHTVCILKTTLSVSWLSLAAYRVSALWAFYSRLVGFSKGWVWDSTK